MFEKSVGQRFQARCGARTVPILGDQILRCGRNKIPDHRMMLTTIVIVPVTDPPVATMAML